MKWEGLLPLKEVKGDNRQGQTEADAGKIAILHTEQIPFLLHYICYTANQYVYSIPIYMYVAAF